MSQARQAPALLSTGFVPLFSPTGAVIVGLAVNVSAKINRLTTFRAAISRQSFKTVSALSAHQIDARDRQIGLAFASPQESPNLTVTPPCLRLGQSLLARRRRLLPLRDEDGQIIRQVQQTLAARQNVTNVDHDAASRSTHRSNH